MNLNELIARVHAEPGVVVENEILQKAVALRVQEAQDRAVAAVKDQLVQFENALREGVKNLRNIRRTERDAATKVANMDRALRYFGASGNPLPFYRAYGSEYAANSFCATLGIPVPEKDDPAWVVPADFKVE